MFSVLFGAETGEQEADSTHWIQRLIREDCRHFSFRLVFSQNSLAVFLFVYAYSECEGKMSEGVFPICVNLEIVFNLCCFSGALRAKGK